MSLQRRLWVYLLLCAPLVWTVALVASAGRARVEVNELFDIEIIHLARQVQATLSGLKKPGQVLPSAYPGSEDSDLRDLALAVWNTQGELLLVDREGVELPYRPQAAGFVEMDLDASPWRVYYLQSPHGEWLVATGQRLHERDELVWNLVGSQLFPWVLMLPVLLLTMAWAARRALSPVRALAVDLQRREADELHAIPTDRVPAELKPLLKEMNGLFARIDATLARERRFTADAAHELRTPLAVLRAQWDVQRHAATEAERREAEAKLGKGFDRLERLVSQMLVLSRVDASEGVSCAQLVDWRTLVEQAMSDVLPLAERRRIELGCDWPPAETQPFPLRGDVALLGVLLRNLLDNAVRYAPEGSAVSLRFDRHGLEVANGGPALTPEALDKLGERFYRREGQSETGSGLGISIARRIAVLHGLQLQHRAAEGREGVVVSLRLKACP
jgi:two-component system sensor histidine kinase QseC